MSLPSPWGAFTRDSVMSLDGEVRLFERFSVAGDPHLTLETGDVAIAAGLLNRLEEFLSHRAQWDRAATDAVVIEFSSEDPTKAELDEAADDLRAEQIVILPDAAVTTPVSARSDARRRRLPWEYAPARARRAGCRTVGIRARAHRAPCRPRRLR
ncbi:hypothetical protein GCM10009862_25240 [Microbacterium binotii]|uniref:Uncharacterized protein n=1 Tax=Microbacterium binotii TaxID=462710 RepID=A0ABN3PGW3_9MICO